MTRIRVILRTRSKPKSMYDAHRLERHIDLENEPHTGGLQETLDLSLFQRILKESPTRTAAGEPNIYPMRVGYNDRVAVVRYQFPASLPPQPGPVVSLEWF